MKRRFQLFLLGLVMSSAIWMTGVAAATVAVVPYPRVVLYSAPWCKSCTAAREYMLQHNIPFTTKDVGANERFLDEMSQRYRVNAVPVIVIGNDQKVLRGFVQDSFQKAFSEVMASSR